MRSAVTTGIATEEPASHGVDRDLALTLIKAGYAESIDAGLEK
jgi:hypothetical protein